MTIYSSISVTASVGRRGRNTKPDVVTVQERLNALMPASRKHLVVDGLSGPKTEGMIADFQKAVLNFRRPDARVDPGGKTIRAMNDNASINKWARASVVDPTGKRRRKVNLHFRSISLTNVSFEKQFKACQDVYAQYDVDIKFASGESALLSPEEMKKFKRVDTSCIAGKDEWSALQKVLNKVPSRDICVIFVGTLWDPKEKPGSEMFLGCGAYRPGSPACAVASNASKYDLAHEVGHVLGLAHDATNGNLMHPTQAAYPKLPVLTPAQVATVEASRLSHLV